MKRAGNLMLGVVVLFAMIACIAYLSGYISGGNVTINPSAFPTVLFFFLIIGFIGGCSIGIFWEANAKEWLAQIQRKQQEILKKQLEKTDESK